MINQDRLIKHFLDLVQIDSISLREQDIALALKSQLEALGAEVEIDDAGERVKGNTGNIIARFSGNTPAAQPILLSAHMDTVSPGEGVKPITEGEIIRGDGSTILGSDDKAGIAIIFEAMRAIKETNAPHGDVEAVFTICEEIGMLGSKNLDYSRLRSRFGLVLDGEYLSRLDIKAPAADWMEFRIHGVDAHAGLYPERGISAIRIAAEAIAKMKLGRIDDETTANIGVIHGGLATNIIPNLVVLEGEARSHDETKLNIQSDYMRQCVEDTASRYRLTIDGRAYEARVEETRKRDFPAMNVPKDSQIVRLVFKAANELGIPMQLSASGGGFDGNIFNANGIVVVDVGTGMRNIHTVKEYLIIEEMIGATNLIVEVLQLITTV